MPKAIIVLVCYVAEPSCHASAEDDQPLHDAATQAVRLVEETSAKFLQARQCFACHTQTLSAMVLRDALERGFEVDRENLKRQVERASELHRFTKSREPSSIRVDTVGHGLWALDIGQHAPDRMTEDMTWYLLNYQKNLGHWKTTVDRPPSEASDFTTNYLAVRGLKRYGTAEQQEKIARRLAAVQNWLDNSVAADTEDQVFRLRLAHELGLSPLQKKPFVNRLLQEQHSSGGWAQMPDMQPDAYATGSALVALHQAGGTRTNHSAWRRGIDYLMRTQMSDGSWHVVTRAEPMQEYFESGFPHGQDQFISAFATGWAAKALLLALDRKNVKNQLIELGERYRRHDDEWAVTIRAVEESRLSNPELSDQDWLRMSDQMELEHPSADATLVPEFLEFARRHKDSQFSLDALAFVIRRGGYSNGDVRSEQWRAKELAIDLVHQHLMDDPRVVGILDLVAGCLPSEKAETFLRASCESSDRNVKAAACFYLSRYLRMTCHVYKRSAYLKTKEPAEGFERFWKLVVTPYLEKNVSFDADNTNAERERLLTGVINEYSDVPALKWKLEGPSGVLFQIEGDPAHETYAARARNELFEMKKLVPGARAPEIDGVDADGIIFRLSDYEGKVILLTFSANWCAGCVELYPLQRDLVRQFHDEPFALLSVSCDTEVDTLKQSTASGDILWRCWWDGSQGPIRQAWNSPGLPTIYLLDDKHIIQDTGLTKMSRQEEFETAISMMLKKAKQANSGIK